MQRHIGLFNQRVAIVLLGLVVKSVAQHIEQYNTIEMLAQSIDNLVVVKGRLRKTMQ